MPGVCLSQEMCTNSHRLKFADEEVMAPFAKGHTQPRAWSLVIVVEKIIVLMSELG